jgi:hypothetical protein
VIVVVALVMVAVLNVVAFALGFEKEIPQKQLQESRRKASDVVESISEDNLNLLRKVTASAMIHYTHRSISD